MREVASLISRWTISNGAKSTNDAEPKAEPRPRMKKRRHQAQPPVAVGSSDVLEHSFKTCRKCGLEKPLTEYYHGGRDTACKPCYNRQAIAWAKANPEKVRAIKKRNWKTRPKRFEESRRWRERNPEKVRAAKRAAYLKNRPYYLARSSAYQAEKWKQNPEKMRARARVNALRQIANVSPGYARRRIKRIMPMITAKDIPERLVRLKIKLIKLKRYAAGK